jgi:hypothetical protein
MRGETALQVPGNLGTVVSLGSGHTRDRPCIPGTLLYPGTGDTRVPDVSESYNVSESRVCPRPPSLGIPDVHSGVESRASQSKTGRVGARQPPSKGSGGWEPPTR